MRIPFVVSLAIAVCTGCGDGGSGDNTPSDEPGTGTGTLEIEATVEARSLINDANDSLEFMTEFFVSVRRAGENVNDAVVTIYADGEPASLPWDQGQDGEYVGSQAGYFRVYALDVIAGADTVEGVRLVGPRIHSISSPKNGGTYDAATDMTVKWDHDGAAEASLEGRDFDAVNIVDSGEYSLPAASVPGEPGKLYTDRFRLERGDVMPISGAIAGSTLRVSVRNEVEFILDGTVP